MNGLPYYKAYPRDFIEGTIGMSFELKGCYRLLLDLIYMQGGDLPDDARYISGVLGCSIRQWKSMRNDLIQLGKVQVSGEFLTNYQARNQLETTAKLQDKNRENATKSNKNKDLVEANAMLTRDYTEPDIDTDKNKKEKETRVAAVAPLFDDFWRMFPNKVGKPVAFKAFSAALKRAPLGAIMAGLARYASKTDDRPWCNPSTFLNQNRWEDQPANIVPMRRNEPPPRRRTAADAMAESARTNGQSTRDAMRRIFGVPEDEQSSQTSDFIDASGFPLIEHRS